jgi:anti-sigma regulatory factor (Ser/Thr protein kinase)
MTAGVEQGNASSELGLLPAKVPPLADIRVWAAAELGLLGEDHLSVVLLVSNELVSNAYEHANSPLRVSLRRTGTPCRVRVEVVDGSAAELTLGRSRLNENRGRGLVLVDELSTDWGVSANLVGKTVWAEVSCGEHGIDGC